MKAAKKTKVNEKNIPSSFLVIEKIMLCKITDATDSAKNK